MVFLEYFVGACVRDIDDTVSVFVREGQAGVAEVIADGVFITQGTSVVVYPAFGVVYRFEHRTSGGGVAVFDTTELLFY